MNNHKRDTKHVILRVLLYLFVILVVLVTLYPYFVMFTTAAKSRAEIYSTDGTLLPIHWLWQNFKDIWTLAPLSRYFINSLIVAGGSTLIAIVCGIPAAYALARMKFKGKKIFLGIVIISQMFAPVVLLVGIYKIMSTFGMLRNSRVSNVSGSYLSENKAGTTPGIPLDMGNNKVIFGYMFHKGEKIEESVQEFLDFLKGRLPKN